MKNLKQKLNEVSKAIKYLKKDKQNKMQGYNYLSEAKIKAVIKAEFEKQGILFNYSTNFVTHYEISQTHKGTKQFCTIAMGSYSFIDIDSEKRMDGLWAGSGTDTGDKGLYKAITGGIKYVMNTNFLIPTGDDPEDDHDINNENGQTKKQSKVEPEKKQSSKSTGGWTEKRKNAIEKIIKSHLITVDERDDVGDIFNKAQKESEKGKLSKTTIERMSYWIGFWYGTKEKDWKDGEHEKRRLQEEKGDLPF